jgi:hypothetical protein
VSPEDLAAAIAFREAFGLRADEAWVRMVAANPAHLSLDSDVPLMPAELDDLVRRNQPAEALYHLIEAYGTTVPSEWAGAFIDQKAGAMVAAQFTGNLDLHRRRISELTGGSERFDVRQVPFSLAQLEGFAGEVRADEAWFSTVGATLFSVEVNGPDNTADAYFIGKDPEAASAISDHFANPPWLTVHWQGPPPWTGPRGNLVIHVVDQNGKSLENFACVPQSQDRLASLGDVASSTGPDGICRFKDLPAVSYRIELVGPKQGVGVVHATGAAAVSDGGTATVRIQVDTR